MRTLTIWAGALALGTVGLTGCGTSGTTKCPITSMQCTVRLSGKGAEADTGHKTFGPRQPMARSKQKTPRQEEA